MNTAQLTQHYLTWKKFKSNVMALATLVDGKDQDAKLESSL